MKSKILIFLILSFTESLVLNCYSQTKPYQFIEEKIKSTVQVKVGSSFGSGIITQDSFNVFLISARHNFFDNNLSLINNFAELKLHSSNFKEDIVSEFILDLRDLVSSHKLIIDTLSDICVIKLAKFELINNQITGKITYSSAVIRKGNQFKMNFIFIDDSYYVSKEDLFLGESVFTVGFPISIGLQKIPQFDYEKPLFKRCSISSLSKKYNNIIIDCQVYGGNSGGPVFLERQDNNKYVIKLIGIIIEYIPFIKSTFKNLDLYDQTSSYAVVVPIEKALALMKKCK